MAPAKSGSVASVFLAMQGPIKTTFASGSMALRQRPEAIIGETDELGLGVTQQKVHVHDINATILHLLGFDHERLTYRFQGRDYRLTDVHGDVVSAMLA